MSKQYGLIVPNKKQTPVARSKIFDSDSDSEDPPQLPTSLKRLKPQDKFAQERAVEEDPTVFQYDEIYDEMDQKRKELLQSKNKDRQPKYITKLLAAADRRKREHERRIERLVQKEREEEGDEFKDKEAFVTSAYKKKLEEMKEMEEQEKREEYLEEIGSVKKQGNLDGFYRHLYDQKVNYGEKPQEIKQEEEEEDKPKRKYRKHESSDEEVEERDTKEHLQSNLDADSDFSIDSSDEENDVKPKEAPVVSQPPEELKIEEPQVDKQAPEVVEVKPEPASKIDIWKKRTVGDTFTAALLRYHERKSSRTLVTF